MIASRSPGTLRWRGWQIGNQGLRWFVFTASIIGHVCRTFGTSYFRHSQDCSRRVGTQCNKLHKWQGSQLKVLHKTPNLQGSRGFYSWFCKDFGLRGLRIFSRGLRSPLYPLYTQWQISETIREADQCWMSHCPSTCPLCVFAKCMST